MVGWLNKNTWRKYPLSEVATCIDDKGNKLPTNIITDMAIVVPSVKIARSVRLAHVLASPYARSITIVTDTLIPGYYSTIGNSTLLAQCTIAYDNTKHNKAVALRPSFPGVSGYIVLGDYNPSDINGNQFSWVFSSLDQARLESSVIRHIPAPGVLRLAQYSKYISQDHYDVSDNDSGIIDLAAQGGITFRLDNTNKSKIIVSLEPEYYSKYANQCDNPTDEECGTVPLKSINGVSANDNGEITIRFE